MTPTNWDPHNPDISLYLRELKMSTREKLTSAFLISTKRSFSFMFMTSDLLDHVYNNANSSRSLFPGFSQGDWLLLGFCCQFPVEMHVASISVIHPWPFGTLSQITPPVIWTRIYGHSLNVPSCGPVIFFLLRVRNDSRFLFTKLYLYSKGEYKNFENQFRKTILV